MIINYLIIYQNFKIDHAGTDPDFKWNCYYYASASNIKIKSYKLIQILIKKAKSLRKNMLYYNLRSYIP